MDKEVKEYRRKHPKCKWCKWRAYRNVQYCAYSCYPFCECTLKEKILHGDWKARFCKWYKLKTDKEDIEDEISTDKTNR